MNTVPWYWSWKSSAPGQKKLHTLYIVHENARWPYFIFKMYKLKYPWNKIYEFKKKNFQIWTGYVNLTLGAQFLPG